MELFCNQFGIGFTRLWQEQRGENSQHLHQKMVWIGKVIFEEQCIITKRFYEEIFNESEYVHVPFHQKRI